MKKTTILTGLFLVLLSVNVTASSYITGTIYLEQAGVGNELGGANVDVTCNGYSLSTVSFNSFSNLGHYDVSFGSGQCPDGYNVSVRASYAGMVGSGNGITISSGVPGLNFATINVLVPKFISTTMEIISRTSRKMRLPRIRVTEVVKAGDYLDVNINIQNSGNMNMKGITASIIVADLALRKSVKVSKIKGGRDTTKEIKLFIPSDTLPGVYDVRIRVSDGHTRKVKYRSFRVV